MADTPTLPNFRRPPVSEVALAVHFEPLTSLQSVHLGLLWSRWRDRFPRVQELANRPPIPDELVPPPVARDLHIELVDEQPVPLVWFVSDDGEHVVQVQNDRLVHNWRKAAEHTVYPRYRELRPRLEDELRLFDDFLEDEKLGQLTPVQCEITYLNPVGLAKHPATLPPIERVVAPWSGRYTDDFLPPPEETMVSSRYRIVHEDQMCGSLYIRARPYWRQGDDATVLMLELVARGRPFGQGIEGAFTFLDLAHQWIVQGFVSFTTSEMHQAWERET
ncbi:MAG: TIGR04255 family protein [Egibacteraceae bacterium]